MNAKGPNKAFGQMQNASQDLGSSNNVSLFREFLIVGGELGLKDFYTELAVLLLVVYLFVLIGNIMIFSVVMLDSRLHTPMYIFLSNLSFIDIVITTTVLPKMISVCLLNDIAISFSGCFLQLYVYLAFQSSESCLLGAMAYDRYVAICNPLRYNNIVTTRTCALLAISALALGLLFPLPSVIPASKLPFCNNQIFFWFCDFPPVVTLSCLDPAFFMFLALGSATLALCGPFAIVIWSYCKIIRSISRITSLDGRKKAFSTCSSHLIVVFLFYFAHMCVYISATAKHVPPNVLTLISILNCFLTPLVNPIIYSFRNKELKVALQKLVHVNKGFP
ncbi:olfactory receptor 6N2-like [Megalops cyprinoides]|uniref:olfactory receptor 6N2-like n=1 Tax=Megalops cyprinoides TaxID=118141 RepID=UPI00186498EE|nr:olfactory receptor 6N2-like [Megalops cyprinoides]